jgi:hypothetical protein
MIQSLWWLLLNLQNRYGVGKIESGGLFLFAACLGVLPAYRVRLMCGGGGGGAPMERRAV